MPFESPNLLHILLCNLLCFCGYFVCVSANPVESVLFLILAFCNAAAILFMFHAEFLGLIYIIIYVGAIAVLFLFVIMMLNIKSQKKAEKKHAYIAVYFFFSFVFSFWISLDTNIICMEDWIKNLLTSSIPRENITFNDLRKSDAMDPFLTPYMTTFLNSIRIESIMYPDMSSFYITKIDKIDFSSVFLNSLHTAKHDLSSVFLNTIRIEPNMYPDLSSLYKAKIDISSVFLNSPRMEPNMYKVFSSLHIAELEFSSVFKDMRLCKSPVPPVLPLVFSSNLILPSIVNPSSYFSSDVLNLAAESNSVLDFTLLIDDLNNIDVMGQFLFNYYFVCFLLAGLILLIALIGSIVLTLRFNHSEEGQLVNRQLSRTDNFLSFFK